MKNVKSIFLLTNSLLFLSLSQAADISGLKIGLKVAPQLTWGLTDNKNTSNPGTRINVGYGLMIDYYFSNYYALSTEVCINSYGVNNVIKKDRYDHVSYAGVDYPNTGDITMDYRLQYMQVPILIRMRTEETNRISYFAEFGFGLGLLTRARADVSFQNITLKNVKVSDPDQSDDYRIFYNSGTASAPQYSVFNDNALEVRSSLIIGGGLHFALGNHSLIVAGLRYDNAFSSFTEEDKWFTKLNYVALNMGIIF